MLRSARVALRARRRPADGRHGRWPATLELLRGTRHRLLPLPWPARGPSDEARRQPGRGRAALPRVPGCRAAPASTSWPIAPPRPSRWRWCAPPGAGWATRAALICAGSVDSPARIHALAEAGCDAFTIGSAAFDGSFSPRRGLLTGQLAEILAAHQACLAPRGGVMAPGMKPASASASRRAASASSPSCAPTRRCASPRWRAPSASPRRRCGATSTPCRARAWSAAPTAGRRSTTLAHEPSLDERYKAIQPTSAPHRQARRRHVLPGDVLMIDSGATTGHFVRRLAVELMSEITVITNSIAHAAVLGTNASISVILCPGYYVARERGIYGPEVAQYLQALPRQHRLHRRRRPHRGGAERRELASCAGSSAR